MTSYLILFINICHLLFAEYYFRLWKAERFFCAQKACLHLFLKSLFNNVLVLPHENKALTTWCQLLRVALCLDIFSGPSNHHRKQQDVLHKDEMESQPPPIARGLNRKEIFTLKQHNIEKSGSKMSAWSLHGFYLNSQCIFPQTTVIIFLKKGSWVLMLPCEQTECFDKHAYCTEKLKLFDYRKIRQLEGCLSVSHNTYMYNSISQFVPLFYYF